MLPFQTPEDSIPKIPNIVSRRNSSAQPSLRAGLEPATATKWQSAVRIFPMAGNSRHIRTTIRQILVF